MLLAASLFLAPRARFMGYSIGIVLSWLTKVNITALFAFAIWICTTHDDNLYSKNDRKDTLNFNL